MPSEFEDPSLLLSRLKLGREEFCQRLLTTLIVGGTYPRWNSRSTPMPSGRRFLEELDRMSFGAATPLDEAVFVDELELAPLSEGERGGAPDWAVLWPARTWLVELKTEAGSHRPTQLPGYFALSAHHHPSTTVDITYLTGPLTKPAPMTGERQRYSHLTWTEALPLVRSVWDEGPAAERRYVDVLVEVASNLDMPWAEQRQIVVGQVPPPTPSSAPKSTEGAARAAPPSAPSVSGSVEEAIAATAADGTQQALDPAGGSLDDLLELRQRATNAVAATEPGSAERHVRPWVWRQTSGGSAMTAGGAEFGYELRFSRYTKPL